MSRWWRGDAVVGAYRWTLASRATALRFVHDACSRYMASHTAQWGEGGRARHADLRDDGGAILRVGRQGADALAVSTERG